MRRRPRLSASSSTGSRAALLYSAGRERTKTTNIKIVHEQRLALRELGRRFVERGTLDTIEQIFMFTNDEMDEVVAKPEAFTSTAREREAIYLQLFELEPPFIIDGVVPPLPTWPRRGHGAPEAVAAGTTLTGIPGSPGKATGRARVVLDPRIRACSNRATSSSLPIPTRRGRRCSSPPRPWSSTSAPRSPTR